MTPIPPNIAAAPLESSEHEAVPVAVPPGGSPRQAIKWEHHGLHLHPQTPESAAVFRLWLRL